MIVAQSNGLSGNEKDVRNKERIQQLESENAELREMTLELEKLVATLLKQVADLKLWIADLEAQSWAAFYDGMT